jgi:hypothetical protein
VQLKPYPQKQNFLEEQLTGTNTDGADNWDYRID